MHKSKADLVTGFEISKFSYFFGLPGFEAYSKSTDCYNNICRMYLVTNARKTRKLSLKTGKKYWKHYGSLERLIIYDVAKRI